MNRSAHDMLLTYITSASQGPQSEAVEREGADTSMNINPKQLEKAMAKMGMRMENIEAEEVVIKTASSEIVIKQPQVAKVNMMGQETFQISGQITERPKEPFTEDDIEMVVNQTGASRDDVKRALAQTHGDLAESILMLKKKK